jgi:hypothetical protein
LASASCVCVHGVSPKFGRKKTHACVCMRGSAWVGIT